MKAGRMTRLLKCGQGANKIVSGDPGGTEDDRSNGPWAQVFTVLMYICYSHLSRSTLINTWGGSRLLLLILKRSTVIYTY